MGLSDCVTKLEYPFTETRPGLWKLAVDTGLMNLIIEIVEGNTMVWVRTSNYFRAAENSGMDSHILGYVIRAEGGYSRMKARFGNNGAICGIEFICCSSLALITDQYLTFMVENVLQSAIWHLPKLMALAMGFPEPPDWPEGEDPSMGLIWSSC